MTRHQLVQHLLHQARQNGFELRRWFRSEAALPWPGGDGALEWLAQGRRVNLVLFSHTFAQAFFTAEGLRQVQPPATYQRTAANGTTRTVNRRAHARRTRNHGAWQYHMQQMALAPEPLQYAKRFLISAETVANTARATPMPAVPVTPVDYDDELLVREA